MILNIILFTLLGINPGGQAYFNHLQKRDSILVADQFEYGFTMDSVKPGTGFAMSDFSKISNDTLTLVRDWKIDTLKINKKTKELNLKASVVLAPFEEGKYELPPVIVLKIDEKGQKDSLLFEPVTIDVKSMPIDTASFVINDIKGQMTYPVTFRELAPWIGGGILVSAIIVLLILFLLKKAKNKEKEEITPEAAYLVALRELEKYRSDKLWAADKQKALYSGVTDILKVYIDESFKIDAPEMTTAELFDELKDVNITPELFNQTKDFFELADLVKFAKYTASDDDNSKVFPLAVRFVTTTFQTTLEEEQKSE